MKTFIIICLLLAVVLTKRHTADPITQCLQNTCKNEFNACDQDSSCVQALKDCQQEQEQNWTKIDIFSKCFKGQKKAYSAWKCISEKCIGIHHKK